MRVKICGITHVADAAAAIDAGADALGFVFVPGTKRAMTAAGAGEITRHLPPMVARVGLFVNATIAEIEETIGVAGLDTIQLHGDETAEFAELWLRQVRVIKAFRVRDAASLAVLPAYDHACHAVLLDAFDPAAHGGTGTRFDWSLAEQIRRVPKPVIIAGGVRPDNVAEAVRLFRPFAVDVSSGVEAGPGRKDPEKVRALVKNAKAAWLAE